MHELPLTAGQTDENNLNNHYCISFHRGPNWMSSNMVFLFVFVRSFQTNISFDFIALPLCFPIRSAIKPMHVTCVPTTFSIHYNSTVCVWTLCLSLSLRTICEYHWIIIIQTNESRRKCTIFIWAGMIMSFAAILIWILSVVRSTFAVCARVFISKAIFLDMHFFFNTIIILYNAFNNLTIAARHIDKWNQNRQQRKKRERTKQ